MIDEYERELLIGLQYRIKHGEFDLDRMPDAWYYRLAYYITTHAGMLVTSSVFLGAGILVLGLAWVFSLPW